MRWRWHLLSALVLWCASNGDVLAEKRVALVIGNSAYQNASPLANPANDASAIAKLIKDIGFDVVIFRRDLVGTDMRRAVREFSQQTRNADIAVVFYAGHGIELNGANYLVPTDAKLEQDFDVEDEAVPLDRFLTAAEPARRLQLVILDACRDNPFVKRMRRTIATRSIGNGLAKVEVTSSDTLIAFAAKAGSIANDGQGSHSPFTAALLKHLPTPGLDVRLVFGRVRDDVIAATRSTQEPFVYGSLGGSAIALVPAPAAPAANPAIDTRHDYELAERVGTLAAWNSFLVQYPTGFYANLAREQRMKLLQAAAREQAEQEAARKRQEEERRVTDAAGMKAEQEAAKRRAEEERRVQAARAERERAEREKVERERARREELGRAEREKAESEKAQSEETARVEEEQRRLARERVEREKSATGAPGSAQIAMLPPAAEPTPAQPQQLASPSRAELIQAIKKELKRVGCYTGRIDDRWGSVALSRSVGHFVKYAKFSGAASEPSTDFLDALRGSDPGTCPPECAAREVEKNGRCLPKTCPPGHRLGRRGNCVEIASRPDARRQSTSKRQEERPASEGRAKRADSGRDSGWLKCSHSIGSGRGRFRGSADARRFAMIDSCTRSGGK